MALGSGVGVGARPVPCLAHAGPGPGRLAATGSRASSGLAGLGQAGAGWGRRGVEDGARVRAEAAHEADRDRERGRYLIYSKIIEFMEGTGLAPPSARPPLAAPPLAFALAPPPLRTAVCRSS